MFNIKCVICISVLALPLLTVGCGSGSGGGETPVAGTTEVTTTTTNTVNTTTVKDGTVVDTAALISLGEKIFNDTSLSTPVGQSCAGCHTASAGFDDPDNSNATSLGADGGSIGNRNAPTASYAAHIPDLQTIQRPVAGGGTVAVVIGGQFLDGRAESLEEQAKGPFLNPVEMANVSESSVIDKLKTAVYVSDFTALFGADILDDVNKSFNYIADAIAAFERTELFSPESSKFDQVQDGSAVFTVAELNGLNLFNGKAQCNLCHHTSGGVEVFSNFEYKNIGVPENTVLVSALGGGFIDNGLGDITMLATDNGKFRTSNLRNIANTSPYMHNGVFTTLTEVIEFYNVRDIAPLVVAEVSDNVDNVGNIGELNLTPGEINDLVSFLQTLTD